MKDVSLYLNNHALLITILLLVTVLLLIVFISISLYQRRKIIYLKNECCDLNRQIDIRDNRIKSLKKELNEQKKPKPVEKELVRSEYIQESLKPKIEEVIVKEEKPSFLGHTLKLYATAYDSESKCFFNVDKKPTADTIFEITINPHNELEAYLDLYAGAIDKIIDCKDFLIGCCEQIGYGNKMEILERGELLLEEGIWKVVKMLKIKFS